MIQAQELAKSFGPSTAVAAATFTAHDGAVTGLLGPNGAGKTTLLRMLYGLYKPTAGAVKVTGRLGVLPDVTGLYSRLTPREHLHYAAHLQGLRGGAAEAAVERAIHRSRLESLVDRRCSGFSHGERRSVALAQALIHDPPNVVLDEPTNGLDVPAIRRVRRTLCRLAEAGKCVLFSSHVMQEVSAICDRLIVLVAGRVVATGTPGELIAQTHTQDLEAAFVALIGSEEGLN